MRPKRQTKRRAAMVLHRLGWQVPEIAAALEISERSVYRWIAVVSACGLQFPHHAG